MENFTLRQLRYFEALANHGHFGRAAEACSISQPALSVQIKELEESLGIALFERAARNIRLTGFDEEFALRVSETLQSVDDLKNLARASRDQFVGRLRLGVIPTVAPYLLPKLLSKLNSDYDALDVHIRETMTPRLIEELSDGLLDAAIVALPISVSAFTEVPLFSERFFLVRSQEYSGTPVPNIDQLSQERLLMLEEGHCFRDQALSFCNIGSNPRDGLDGSSLATLVQMVGAGLGTTLIPEMAVPVEKRTTSVTIDALNAPAPTRTIGMIWRASSPLAAQFQQIAKLVKSAA